MSNIFEQPEQAPLINKDELDERIFAARNVIQAYYATLVYRNEHQGQEASKDEKDDLTRPIIFERSDDFRAWSISSEGKVALEAYARRHDMASIEAMEDMGDLAQSFLAFMNRSHKETQA